MSEDFSETERRLMKFEIMQKYVHRQGRFSLDLADSSPEDIEKLRVGGVQAVKLDIMSGCLEESNKILTNPCHIEHPAHFFSPISTFEEFESQAKGEDLSALRGEVEEQNSRIDEKKAAIKMLQDTFLSAEAERIVTEGHSFTIGSGNYSETFQIHAGDFEKFKDKTREQVAVLEVALRWHEDVKAIFEKAIKEREKGKDGTLSQIREKLLKITKEARGKRVVAVKAAEKCRASKFTDRKAAQEFLNARDRFNELHGAYKSLRCQAFLFLINGKDLKIDEFPLDLTRQELADADKIESLAISGVVMFRGRGAVTPARW